MVSSQACCITGCSGAGQRRSSMAGLPGRAGFPAHRRIRSLPASELPQQPGLRGASCSRSSRVPQPAPRCLSSPARLGSQEESRLPLRRARPAMAAAPSRHCAQGSFACHIPDMEPSCDGRAAKQPSAQAGAGWELWLLPEQFI